MSDHEAIDALAKVGADGATLMARRQPLGILPTAAFLREVIQARLMPVTLVGASGVVAIGVLAARLVGRFAGGGPGGFSWGVVALQLAVASSVTLLGAGILERLFRRKIRARRLAAARRARELGQEDLARSLESDLR